MYRTRTALRSVLPVIVQLAGTITSLVGFKRPFNR